MRRKTAVIAALAGATAAFVLSACGTDTAATAPSTTATASPVAVTTTTAAPTSAAPKPVDTRYAQLDEWVRISANDAAVFWRTHDITVPVRVAPSTDASVCASEIAGSRAWVCNDGTVVYDREALLPLTRTASGGWAVTLIISHEVGHTAQRVYDPALDTDDAWDEQRADCASGAHMRWIADGNSPRMEVTTDLITKAILDAYPVDGTDSLSPQDTLQARKSVTAAYNSGQVCLS